MIVEAQKNILNAYCEAGWKLIPLRRGDKLPAVAEWEKRATNDIEQLTAWTNQYKTQNIGLVTGETNGIFVLDVDVKKGAKGIESMKDLISQHGELPDTPLQKTPTGGYHFIFKLPNGLDIRNSAGQIGDGLDIRGYNGFIVVAPSVTDDGAYKWQNGSSLLDVVPADPPHWLIDLIKNAKKKTKREKKIAVNDGAVKKIKEHEGRNQALISFAGTLRAKGIEPNAMLEMLETFSEAHFEPPLAKDELLKVWNSVQRYEAGNLAIAAGAEEMAATSNVRSLAEKRQEKKPVIVVSDYQLDELCNVALKTLHSAGIYQKEGALCRIRIKNGRTPEIQFLNRKSMLGVLSECAIYKKATAKALQNIFPPQELADVLLNLGNYPLPVLDALVRTPLFTPKGRLINREGYDEEAGIYLKPSGDLPGVLMQPTIEAINEGKKLFDDIFCDVLFASHIDKANAYALLLTPIIRPIMDENAPSPVCLIEANKQQTGKGTLAKICSIISTGEEASANTAPRNDEEWRKLVLTLLRNNSMPFLFFDNIKGKLDSQALESIITEVFSQGRILGLSQDLTVKNHATWVFAGNTNDMALSSDMAFRIYRIKLDAKSSNPASRKKKYNNIIRRVKENQKDLLGNLLTMVQYWVNEGMPRATVSGNFAEWREIIGGILETCGIKGFGERDETASDSSQDHQWGDFLEVWYAFQISGKVNMVSSGDFLSKANAGSTVFSVLLEALPDDLEAKIEECDGKKSRSLGMFLSKKAGVPYGELNLVLKGKRTKDGKVWWVEQVTK